MTPEELKQRGREALAYFHNRALRYSDYKLSFDDLITLVSNRGYKNFVQGLGMGIIDAEISERNVKSGMELLADKGKGKIPSTNGAFTQAIASNVSENISYVDAIAYTAKESSIQIATGVSEGLETIGNSTIQGLKVAKFLTEYWWITIPAVVIGYVALNQTIRAKLS